MTEARPSKSVFLWVVAIRMHESKELMLLGPSEESEIEVKHEPRYHEFLDLSLRKAPATDEKKEQDDEQR